MEGVLLTKQIPLTMCLLKKELTSFIKCYVMKFLRTDVYIL